MLLIYLIFEKSILNLPNQISNNEKTFSYDFFRSKDNLMYHILRSLRRKADIRNFLHSILIDALNNLQEIRNYLSLNSFLIKEKDEIKNDDNTDNQLNKSFDNTITERFSKIEVEHRRFSITNQQIS